VRARCSTPTAGPADRRTHRAGNTAVRRRPVHPARGDTHPRRRPVGARPARRARGDVRRLGRLTGGQRQAAGAVVSSDQPSQETPQRATGGMG
jgi:hypothetical protein